MHIIVKKLAAGNSAGAFIRKDARHVEKMHAIRCPSRRFLAHNFIHARHYAGVESVEIPCGLKMDGGLPGLSERQEALAKPELQFRVR